MGVVVSLVPLAACSGDPEGDARSTVDVGLGVRQDAAELTAEQTNAFVDAVRLLQTTPAPGDE